jgi:hypothetical protein
LAAPVTPARVIWDKRRNPTKHVSNALGVKRWELRIAIHKLKARSNLGAADKVIIHIDGKVSDTNGDETGNVSTKSDQTEKAFVTFRISGDDLIPDEVTRLLGIRPTHAHSKGEEYSTGRSTIIGRTGVWMFSTDHISLSSNLFVHLELMFSILGFNRSSGAIGNPSSVEHDLNPMLRILRLKEFLKNKSLSATMTLFWHGSSGLAYPKLPDALIDLFTLIPIAIESDFDRDEDTVRRNRAG